MNAVSANTQHTTVTVRITKTGQKHVINPTPCAGQHKFIDTPISMELSCLASPSQASSGLGAVGDRHFSCSSHAYSGNAETTVGSEIFRYFPLRTTLLSIPNSQQLEDLFAAWFLAGLFCILTLPITLYEVALHLEYYSRPALQRHIIRILLMPPIYALDSWFCLRFISARTVLTPIRECYEAYTIYNFFMYLIRYLDGAQPPCGVPSTFMLAICLETEVLCAQVNWDLCLITWPQIRRRLVI